MKNAIDIFSVRIGLHHNKNTKIHENLLDTILEHEKSEGRVVSNAGGFQSNDLEQSGSLKDFCDEFLFQAFSDFLVGDYCMPPFSISLENAWGNVSYKGCYNHMHEHSFSDFSFVYYLKAPKNCGSLIFEHPSPIMNHNYFFHYAWRRDSTIFNKVDYQLEPEEGMCVIFPSFLRHKVDPNLNKSKRISVAGNLSVKLQ